MDKNTLIILGLGAVALMFVLPQLQGQGQTQGPVGSGAPGFGSGRIGPDGFPLPEDRVLGVLERLTSLGGQIYDTVQSRRGSSSSGMPAPGMPAGAPGGVTWPRA